MRIYMQKTAEEGRVPRYCQIVMQQDLIQGWSIIVESGEQGRSGRVRRQHFDQFDAAQAYLLNARDAQLQRGFKVMFIQGAAPLLVEK